ncbi:MAG: O-antigen ligase domain-containing protein, partial [Planctomycetota bacterium]
MQPIVLIPALVACAVAAARGWRAAWVFVALPAMLVLPAYYTFKPPGIPVATFHNYLLLVILGALFCARDATFFGLRWPDLLPLGLALTAVLS